MEANLKIKLDNASFVDNPDELAQIFRKLAVKVEHGVSAGDSFVVMDSNGNKVGSLEIEEEPRASHKM